MNTGLKDKGVLVLASSTGLGKAGALEFAKEGAKVMMFSHSEEKLVSAKNDIQMRTGNKDVHYTVGNLMNQEDIEKAVHATVRMTGSIDILGNNSGGPPSGEVFEFSDKDWSKAFELTLLSYVRSIRAAFPYMKEQGGGRIVNSTSSSVKSVS